MVDKSYDVELTIVFFNDTSHDITVSKNNDNGTWWYPETFSIDAYGSWSWSETIDNFTAYDIAPRDAGINIDGVVVTCNANENSIYNPCMAENYDRKGTKKAIVFSFTFTDDTIGYLLNGI